MVAVPVRDEMVLLVPEHDVPPGAPPGSGARRAVALNASGRAIWELCDGRRDLAEIGRALLARYEVEAEELWGDLGAALLHLQALGLFARDERLAQPRPAPRRRPVRLLFGIEDTVYFHWQLAVFCESLCGQLPPDWRVWVVVCNEHDEISEPLRRLFEIYDIDWITAADHPSRERIDFATGGERYVPLNRITALAAVADHLAPEDLVCLLDTDVFLYGDLRPEVFPRGDAVAANWLVAQEPFFSFGAETEGVHLPTLLESLGCPREFRPGGVAVFLTGATLAKRKVIADCYRFAQVLYLLGKVLGLGTNQVWISEMACFALALVPNGIDYEVLDGGHFAIHGNTTMELESGTFYHYYQDLKDGLGGAFPGSQWHKQLFRERDLLDADLESFHAVAASTHERRFFELAMAARERIKG